MADTVIVGKSVVRTDAAAKVCGGATYGVDVRFGGMLVGKTLRAGIPHARIVNLDTSAAVKVPGVRAIVTGHDCSGRHGLFQKDQPALAIDRVNRLSFLTVDEKEDIFYDNAAKFLGLTAEEIARHHR